MSDSFQTLSPIDGSVVCERPLSSEKDAEAALDAATRAKREWRSLPLSERIARLNAFVDAIVARKSELADELTLQMGRPRRYTEGEIGGFEDRARRMLGLATGALAPIDPGPKQGFTRRITREPLGTVLALELPLAHRGQRDRSRHGSRQRGHLEALRSNALGE